MASLRAIVESEAGDDVETIDAARVNLRDGEKTYASLFVAQIDEKRAPCLTLYDERGAFRAVLSLAGGTPGLCFLDEKRNFRLMAFLSDEEDRTSPQLAMFDEEGNHRLAVGVDPDGEPYIVLLGADGSVVDRLPSPAHAGPIQKPGH